MALQSVVPDGTMEAVTVNSWGSTEARVSIDAANFVYDITFDPTITAKTKSGGISQACPPVPVRGNFKKRLEQLSVNERGE